MGWLDKYKDGQQPKILQDFEKFRTSPEGKDTFRMMEENRIAKKRSGRIEYSDIDPITDIALPLAGIAGIVGKQAIKQGVKQAGRYLTEETALKNSYKVNPWAVEAHPEKWYRQVDASGFSSKGILPPEDLLEKTNRILSQKGKTAITPDEWEKMSNLRQTFVTGQQLKEHSSNYFKKGKLWYGQEANRPQYLYEAKFGDEGFLPELNNKRFRTFEGSNNVGVLKDSPELQGIDNYVPYKKNWLQGYKEIPKQENGGKMQEHQPNFNNSSISIPKDYVGLGHNTKGRRFSPAWGGQFEKGGELKKLDQLTNFNNFGQSKKNWLEQYSK